MTCSAPVSRPTGSPRPYRLTSAGWAPGTRCDPWAGSPDTDIGAAFAALVPTCTALDAARPHPVELAA